MQANFKGFTFVDEASVDRDHHDTLFRERFDEDMEEAFIDAREDWEDPFENAGANRGDRMAGIVKTVKDDLNMFHGGNFDM